MEEEMIAMFSCNFQKILFTKDLWIERHYTLNLQIALHFY